RPHRVGDEEDGAGVLADRPDPALRTVTELLVADVERLVDDEDLVLDRGRDRELQPLGHPRGVRAHRQVDEVLEPGELDDVVEYLFHLRAGQPQGEGYDDEIAGTGEVRDERGTDTKEVRPRLRIDRALRGRGQPGDRAHERGFAGAVGADDADGLVAV